MQADLLGTIRATTAPSCGVASAPGLEEIADQPTGACANHDRVRLGRGLQAGGEGMLFMEAEG
jgi:hypothetical protein